jgi:PAS domain S-box-containing protein
MTDSTLMNTNRKAGSPLALRDSLTSPLIRKGLIIIAVPLIFAVVFIAGLKLLLDQAEAQAEREAKSRSLIMSANALGGAVVTAVTDSYTARLIGTEDANKRADDDVTQTTERFQELQKQVIPGTRQSELVEKIGAELRAAFSMAGVGRFAKREELDAQQLSARRTKMQAIMQQLLNDAQELMKEEEKRENQSPLREEDYKQLIDRLIYGGIAFEVLLAFGLMIFFSANITSRLSVLMDNAERMVEDAELNQPVGGRDEIAYLDSAFHETVEKLQQSHLIERQLLSRLQSIIETIPLGIIICSDDGVIVSSSPNACRMFGYSAQDMEKLHLNDIFKLGSGKSSSDLLSDLAKKGSKFAHSCESMRSDNKTFPAEVLSTEFNTTDTNGRLLVISDVTEKFEMEQLKQSFVSMVSHELRSPLTSLQFCFTMLPRGHMGELKELGVSKAQMAAKNVKRLISLVNEILDAERLESGQLTIERAQVELLEILEMSAGSVSALAEKAAVTINVEPIELEINVDKNRIVQVVVNLLSNAIKFSPPESTITLSAVRDADFLEVRVTDQGRGIPPEHLDLIFKRFHQVKKTDASEKGGTGLGLAICRALVEGHCGEIGVRSTVGVGSTFWFKLPLSAPGA